MLLDQLLQWPVTTEQLAALLALEPEARWAEGLCFEYKGQWTKRHIAKTAAAFANAEGGYLFLGIEAQKGVPVSAPGLVDEEWGLRVSQEIIGNVSPLPAWKCVCVPSPQDVARVVAVVRVEQSTRAPHLITGRVYIRTPGGESVPLEDRAELDHMYARSEQGRIDNAYVARLHSEANWVLPGLALWRFSAIAVPLPRASAPFPLTKSAHDSLPTLLRDCRTMKDPTLDKISEESILVESSGPSVRVFEDGTLEICFNPDLLPQPMRSRIEPDKLMDYVADLLTFQQRREVHEVYLSLQIVGSRSAHVSLYGPSFDEQLSLATPPDPWQWSGETRTDPDAAALVVKKLANRLWRTVGLKRFEPE